MERILFVDLEVDPASGKLQDAGWLLGNREGKLADLRTLRNLGEVVLCGHNVFWHDAEMLKKEPRLAFLAELPILDTLAWSPLLRPDVKAHHLGKDYKLSTTWRNDPLADARLARDLLFDLLNLFAQTPPLFQHILQQLLGKQPPFAPFFDLLPDKGKLWQHGLPAKIRRHFDGKLCVSRDLDPIIANGPRELAYVLAFVQQNESHLSTPSWLLSQFPLVEIAFNRLRAEACDSTQCSYCQQKLDPIAGLQDFFGFPGFRRFDGDGEMPLQEKAVRAALADQSLLAIFPTGGGKSLTFQLPALMRGRANGALTVVISPLVSLMKDQVDNLREKDIVAATAINGLLSPLERSEAIERVENRQVHLLYISPESLRSFTILRLLSRRIIDRFVIDEAHCFSAWGHDFRVDYLFIGPFLLQLEKRKGGKRKIPVSCFTATARPEVIADIRGYFKERLGRNLELFQTHQGRVNLGYQAMLVKDDQQKYERLLQVLASREGPAIVYVSRVRKTEDLVEGLRKEGIPAMAYHGKMKSKDKRKVQEAFKENAVEVIVATSAFGMGVDKDNVELVVHYEVSNSLENYVQEAGRAGRDPGLQARCVVLFNPEDLDKHFQLQLATKLNQKDIQQIWKAIKDFKRPLIAKSALQIAGAAGWDEEMRDLETRVRTAVNALEEAKLLERLQNKPLIFADSLVPKSFEVAMRQVRGQIHRFTHKQQDKIESVLQYIFSHRKDVRIDYMAEVLGIPIQQMATILNELVRIGVLADHKDLTAKVVEGRSAKASAKLLQKYGQLEKALQPLMDTGAGSWIIVNLRELNDVLGERNLVADIPMIRRILRYWELRGILKKERQATSEFSFKLIFKKSLEIRRKEMEDRLELAGRIFRHVSDLPPQEEASEPNEKVVAFSLHGLKKNMEGMDLLDRSNSLPQYQHALLYLHEIEALELLQGFIVMHNRMGIHRTSDQSRYLKESFKMLEEHYQKQVEQIHIVGEYVKRLLEGGDMAGKFVEDYFKLEYDAFLKKYFPGRKGEIARSITPEKYAALFDGLTEEQLAVVTDKRSKRILVSAGPGSGKTMVLVRKMASLLLMEDIKTSQFLMLAFSRPAAQEFRDRLAAFLPGVARHVDIHTYHSFAFQLLGQKGDLDRSQEVIRMATEAILEDNVPLEKVKAKSVIVLDEFQDISQQEFDFLQALLFASDGARVVAAGDDDQAIYGFRGASSGFMDRLLEEGGKKYLLSTNFRAQPNLVAYSNSLLPFLGDKREKSGVELRAHRQGSGRLVLARYTGGFILPKFVEAILAGPGEGTTAVLTRTNAEALLVQRLLRSGGLPALLWAAEAEFSLQYLHELQYFTQLIRKAGGAEEAGLVLDPEWREAVDLLQRHFKGSEDLPFSLRVVKEFARTHKRKYKSDWKAYVSRLNMEDFFFPSQDKVIVSTMHKAKGKEFDRVYVLLENYSVIGPEQLRAVYVALTRAREHLEVHTNGPFFERLDAAGLERRHLEGAKENARILTLACSLKDVHLGGFHSKSVQDLVAAGASAGLRAGSLLEVDEAGQFSTLGGEFLGEFSVKFRMELEAYRNRGYRISQLKVGHVVFWYDKKIDKGSLVALPEVELERI